MGGGGIGGFLFAGIFSRSLLMHEVFAGETLCPPCMNVFFFCEQTLFWVYVRRGTHPEPAGVCRNRPEPTWNPPG